MLKWIFGLGVILPVFALAVFAQESGTDTKQQKAKTFASPILAITLVSDDEDLALLQDVEEQVLGERRFLVGHGVDDEEQVDWRNGKRVWIAIDDVQQIVEFENIEAFNKAFNAPKGDSDMHAASSSRPRTRTVARH